MAGINTHEYLLQGSILDSAHGLLVQRLKGLTDPKSENFNEQELVFGLKGGIQGGTQVMIHVRRSLDDSTAPWHLRYVGNPEPDPTRQIPTLVRKAVDTLVKSDDLMEFLREMGFRLQYEFVAKGEIYTKGPLKIVISKIYHVKVAGNASSSEPFTDSRLVELSVLAPSVQDVAVSKSIRDFADQLKPVVQLEKIDYSQLIITG